MLDLPWVSMYFTSVLIAETDPAVHTPVRSSPGSTFIPAFERDNQIVEAACSMAQDTEATAGDANMDDAGGNAEAGSGAAPSDGGAAAADAAAEAADAAGERPAGAADSAATTPMETEDQAAQPAAITVKKRTKKIPVPVKAETASIPDPVVQVRTCAKRARVGSVCSLVCLQRVNRSFSDQGSESARIACAHSPPPTHGLTHALMLLTMKSRSRTCARPRILIETPVRQQTRPQPCL